MNQLSLIIPKDQNPEKPVVFLGMLYLASYLKRKGIDVKIYDEQLNEATKNINEIIKNNSMVGFTVMTSQLKSAKELSEKIHKENIKIVWGGAHPLLFPEQCLKEDYIDYVAYDEGEETLLDLFNGKDIRNIKGIYYKQGNLCFKNPPRDYINLNELRPDWSLMDLNKYQHKVPIEGEKVDAFPLHVGRGCPFGCTFCIQTILNKRVHRSLAAENIIKEIKKILEKREVNVFDLEDDNFFMDLERVKEFCRLYKENKFTFKWVGTCRVNYILKMDDDFIKGLKEGGCVLLRMGLESGSQRVLDELIKKGINKDDIFKVIEKVKPYGISLECSFMIGVPKETVEEQNETFDLIKKIMKAYNKVHIIGAQLYRPYPSAEMYDDAKELGFKEPKSIDEWIEFLNNFGFLDINQLTWIPNKKQLLRKCKYFAWSQIKPKRWAKPIGLLFRSMFRLRMKVDFYYLGFDIWLYEKIKNIYLKN